MVEVESDGVGPVTAVSYSWLNLHENSSTSAVAAPVKLHNHVVRNTEKAYRMGSNYEVFGFLKQSDVHPGEAGLDGIVRVLVGGEGNRSSSVDLPDVGVVAKCHAGAGVSAANRETVTGHGSSAEVGSCDNKHSERNNQNGTNEDELG